MTDDLHELIPALRAGEAQAWHELTVTLSRSLLAYAHGVTADWAGAQDAVQDALLSVYRTRRRLRPDSEVRGYCFRAVRNYARNAVRDKALRRKREQEAADMTASSTSGDHRARELWEAASRLPGQLREVIELRFRHGLTLAEVAEVLRVPEGTVSTRQRRGLEELRGKLGLAPAFALPEALRRGAAAPAVPSETLKTVEGMVMASITKKGVSAGVLALLLLLVVGGAAIGAWAIHEANAPANELTPGMNEAAVADKTERPADQRPAIDHESGKPATSRTGKGKRNGEVKPAETPEIHTPADKPEGEATTPKPAPEAVEKPKDDQQVVDFANLTVTISGHVYDHQNKPIAGQTVLISNDIRATDSDLAPVQRERHDNIPSVPATYAKPKTDADGLYHATFKLPGYRPGPHDIKAGYVRLTARASNLRYVLGLAKATIAFKPGDTKCEKTGVDIRMALPFRVRCHVSDEQGDAVAGATCYWTDQVNVCFLADGQPVTATTDAYGIAEFVLPLYSSNSLISYRLDGVKELIVDAEGYAWGAKLVRMLKVPAGSVQDVEITLGKPGKLAGVLVDSAQRPIANARVNVALLPQGTYMRVVPPKVLTGDFRTGPNGEFSFDRVGPGVWTIQFSVDGFRRYATRARCGTTDMMLMLTSVNTVTITYHDARSGRLLRPCGYDVERAASVDGNSYGDQVAGGGMPGGDDALVIENMVAGHYRLTVRFEGVGAPFSHEIEVADGKQPERDVQVSLAGGVGVTGVVHDKQGKPLAGVNVLLTDATPGNRPAGLVNPNVAAETKTAADGSFSFEGLEAKQYRAEIRASGYAVSYADADLRRQAHEPLDVTMYVGATIKVTVPATPAGAAWRFMMEAKSRGETRSMSRHEDGNPTLYVFKNVYPGQVTLKLSTTEWLTLDFDDDPQAVKLDCPDGGVVSYSFADAPLATLSGTLVDASGKPVANQMLMLDRVGPNVSDDDIPEAYFGRYVITDTNGHWAAHGLLPGRYVFVKDFKIWKEVRVEPSSNQTLDLVND